jgi:hypothetical protein
MKLMNHETALSNAKEIADRVLAPAAQQNDKKGRISSQAVATFGRAGLLRMMLPAEVGGFALGPRPFAAVVATLTEAGASVEMVYLMHVSAAATIAAACPGAAAAPTLKEIAAGRHLSTLAFSEAGSRSHFWAPVARGRRNAGGASAAMRACGGDRVLKTYDCRATIPGCPRARRHGADGRCSARIHREGGSGNAALLSDKARGILKCSNRPNEVLLGMGRDKREGGHESNNLVGRRSLRSEGGHDLGRYATLLSRGGASSHRGRAVPELRGAGKRPLGRAR